MDAPLTLHDNAGSIVYIARQRDSTLTLTHPAHWHLPSHPAQRAIAEYRPDTDYVVVREGENALTANFTACRTAPRITS